MANIIFTKKSLSSSIEGDIKVNSKADAGTYSITTIDHDKLKNRDLPDQHPIEAITGLTDTIQEIRQEETDTNVRIDELATELNEDVAALEQADQDILEYIDEKDTEIYEEIDKLKIPSTYYYDLDESPTYSPTRVYYEKVADVDLNTSVGTWRFHNHLTMPTIVPAGPGVEQPDPTQFNWVAWHQDNPDYEEDYFKYRPYIFDENDEKAWPFMSWLCLEPWSTKIAEQTTATKLVYGLNKDILDNNTQLTEDELAMENDSTISDDDKYWVVYDTENNGWQADKYKELYIPASPNVDPSVNSAFLKFLNLNATKLLDWTPEEKVDNLDNIVKYKFVIVRVTEETYEPGRYYYLNKSIDPAPTPSAGGGWFKTYQTLGDITPEELAAMPDDALVLIGTDPVFNLYQRNRSNPALDDFIDLGPLQLKDFTSAIAAINQRITEDEATINLIDADLDAEITRATEAETALSTNLNERIDQEVEDLNTRITEEVADLDTRITEEVETINQTISDEVDTLNDTISNVNSTLETAIEAEASTRSAADITLQNNIDTQAGIINAIEAKIPAQASAQNQLADKAFVNSSIETNTATYRGSHNLVEELQLPLDATHAQIATALATVILTADNNDYCFVQIPTDVEDPEQISKIERYKFVEAQPSYWDYEYDLNNSGFTAAQWAAINSNATDVLITQITTNQTNIGVNSQDIQAEITRATEKENLIDTDIDNIEADIRDINTDLATLNTVISTETTRAEGEETALANSIAQVAQDLSTEETTRADADRTLTTNLGEEITRATSAENAINADLVDETVRAIVTDTDLDARTEHLEAAKVVPNPVLTGNEERLSTVKVGTTNYVITTETDDEYDPTSVRPQSGKAVAEAIDQAIDVISETIINLLNTPI